MLKLRLKRVGRKRYPSYRLVIMEHSFRRDGKPIDEVIVDQVTLMDPALVKSTNSAFAELKNGKLTRNYPQALSAIFNIETQRFFLISLIVSHGLEKTCVFCFHTIINWCAMSCQHIKQKIEQ